MPDYRRLQKDLAEVADWPATKLDMEPDDLTKFTVYAKVTDGLYRNHWFQFLFIIPDSWPNEAPKVKIQEKIWHPNNAESGNICVSQITSNYLASMVLTTLIEALKFLLRVEYINASDARNIEAAQEYLNDKDKFFQKARNMMEEITNDAEYEDEDK